MVLQTTLRGAEPLVYLTGPPPLKILVLFFPPNHIKNGSSSSKVVFWCHHEQLANVIFLGYESISMASSCESYFPETILLSAHLVLSKRSPTSSLICRCLSTYIPTLSHEYTYVPTLDTLDSSDPCAQAKTALVI